MSLPICFCFSCLCYTKPTLLVAFLLSVLTAVIITPQSNDVQLSLISDFGCGTQLHLGVDARGSHLKLEGAAYNCADFRSALNAVLPDALCGSRGMRSCAGNSL